MMYIAVVRAVGEKMKDTPPRYENLSDTRTIEWCLAEELRTLSKDLRKLSDLADNAHTELVQGLQYDKIKDWSEIAESLATFTKEMAEELKAIHTEIW